MFGSIHFSDLFRSLVLRIKCALVAFVAATPLLLIFSFGGKYFLCNPPLWRTTVASHWAEGVWLDLGVVTAWCAMQFLFRSIIASIPKARRAKQRNENNLSSCKSKMVRILVWFLWICIVSILSLPSIFFTCAQSLPSQNAWGLSNQMFQLFYTTAPILAVLIDMALATPLSSNFSRCTGVKADRLLMTFRLFSAWLLAMITTAALDENCLGGWKISWKVCQEGSEEHNRFNWKVYDEEILNTTQDICSFSTTWWHDGRCSRTIVGSVTPFLLGKLLIRSTVQPAALWTFWQFSRLEAAPDRKQGGRHRRLFGVWPKTTGSLIPLQQMAFLTTQMDTWQLILQKTAETMEKIDGCASLTRDNWTTRWLRTVIYYICCSLAPLQVDLQSMKPYSWYRLVL